MTVPARAASQYLETQVRSCTPLELVVLLYDSALLSGRQARAAFDRRDIPARRAALSRMLGIVSELQSTLDMDRGGDIARNLDGLYDWMTARLVEATRKQDPKPLDETLRVLDTLRDGWQTIAKQATVGAAS
jgi:flagellar protein FliS